MDRKLLSLRCDPGHYSTLLWPPAMCNHSGIRQELTCYTRYINHCTELLLPHDGGMPAATFSAALPTAKANALSRREYSKVHLMPSSVAVISVS